MIQCKCNGKNSDKVAVTDISEFCLKASTIRDNGCDFGMQCQLLYNLEKICWFVLFMTDCLFFYFTKFYCSQKNAFFVLVRNILMQLLLWHLSLD